MMNDINLFRIKNSIYLKKIESKVEVLKNDLCDGYLVESSEKECRRIVDSLKSSGKKIGVVGGDDAFNRRVIETLKVDYLVSPECGLKIDTLKQRDSGINHVVAKIARDKKVLIVVDFGEISKLNGKELVLRLSRLIQNMKVCRKVRCGIRIASFGLKKSEVVDELGRKAFGASLGMSSEQVADSVKF